jgi:hypothetical protein
MMYRIFEVDENNYEYHLKEPVSYHYKHPFYGHTFPTVEAAIAAIEAEADMDGDFVILPSYTKPFSKRSCP